MTVSGHLIFAQYQLEAYDKIHNEITAAIMKQRDNGLFHLKVSKYPPKVLYKLSEEFQAEGYGCTLCQPENSRYIEMWLTWGSHQHS